VRRKTAWALGGVLAGTVLLGATGTFATFSDSESLAATAGAGRMALVDPTPAGRGPQVLTVRPDAVLPVEVDIVGAGSAELQLYAEDTERKDPCAAGLDVTVSRSQTVSGVQTATSFTADLCSLAGGGLDLGTVDADTRDLGLRVAVSAQATTGPSSVKWKGSLRLVLVQSGTGGGFSDEMLVPVDLHDPNPQNKAPKPKQRTAETAPRVEVAPPVDSQPSDPSEPAAPSPVTDAGAGA
jgi:predicted ribosomally synthesized peptide with SipW-like signal peptide